MAVPIKQDAQWPGAGPIESAMYRCEHGITPGQIQFTTIPGPSVYKPYAFGNFVIGDGRNSLTVKTCKIFNLDAQAGPQGTTFVVTAEDRRWRWRSHNAGYGAISGRYNRYDARAKIVPWSIRSPIELARYCFQALGETRYVINLPQGLQRSDGENVDRFLRLGENFKQTLANPEIIWDYMPPALALAQLCDIFGCRLVYQPMQDRFSIIPQGTGLQEFGDNIPEEGASVSFSAPPIPKKISIVAAPIRLQQRVALVPVGKEWDGTWIDIDQLTYAPKAKDASNQKATITWNGGVKVPTIYVQISWEDSSDPASNGPQNKESFEKQIDGPINGGYVDLQNDMLANDRVAKLFTFSISGNDFTITATKPELTFTVIAIEEDSPGVEAKVNHFSVKTTPGFIGGKSWRSCPPPTFATVQATDRLAYQEAQTLARDYVFKAFKIVNLDPADRKKPLPIPDFAGLKIGKLKRIQQLIPQQEKVAQVVPSPRIKDGNQRGNLLIDNSNALAAVGGGAAGAIQTALPLQGGILPEFYNGYSRCQAPTVTGSVWKRLIGGVQYFDLADANTKENQRVWVGFDISVEADGTLLVLFHDYVYKYAPTDDARAYIGYPELTLETGFLICDEDLDMPYRYHFDYNLDGGVAPDEFFIHDDVQVSYITSYVDPDADGAGGNKIKEVKDAPGDMEDAKGRAQCYFNYHARKYLNNTQQRINAIGILSLEPDGAVQQIQWSVGSGASTQASINHEFAVTTPSYPVRRRAENIPADESAKIANAAERDFVNRTLGISSANPRR